VAEIGHNASAANGSYVEGYLFHEMVGFLPLLVFCRALAHSIHFVQTKI
jgi:hypothetical protein